MRSARRLVAGGLSIAVATFVAPRADAAPGEVIVVEAYEMPAGCPDAAAFRRSAVRRVYPLRQGGVPLRVSVSVERVSRMHRGTIAITSEHGERSIRGVESPDCEEVVSALALVAALAVEGAPQSAQDETTRIDEPVPARALAPDETQQAQASTRPSIGRERRFTFAFGGQAAVQSGVLPGTVMTVPVFVAFGLAEVRRSETLRARLEPTIRVAGVFGGSYGEELSAGTREVRWTAGAVDACALTIGMSVASFSPCLRLELGALAARMWTNELGPGRTDSYVWAAIGAPVRLRIEVGAHAFFELEGAARLPLFRERYEAGISGFRPSAVGWTAGAGLGVRFL